MIFALNTALTRSIIHVDLEITKYYVESRALLMFMKYLILILDLLQ